MPPATASRAIALLACTLAACSAQRAPDAKNARRAERATAAPRTSADAAKANDNGDASPPDNDLARFTDDLPGKGRLVAVLTTSKGTLRCTLFEDDAPATVANFVGLARGRKAWYDPKRASPQLGAKLYDGLTFHRVSPNFGIQSGDPSAQGDGGPGFTLRDEPHQHNHHRAGSIAMVNIAGPHTAGSQIFIASRDLPQLDGQHTVFGACDNLKVIAAIASTPRDKRGRPTAEVTLTRVRFERASTP